MRAPWPTPCTSSRHRVGDRRPARRRGPRADDAALQVRARRHGAERDDRVDRVADAADRVAHELRGRRLTVCEMDRPLGVVQVEHRHGGDEVHVGVVERVDGADVAPVGAVPFRGPGNVVEGEVVNTGFALVDEVGDDVPAHVVLGVEALGIDVQGFDQGIGVEHVVAHGSQELARVGREAGRRRRLLDERGNLVRVVRIGFDHAELVRHVQRLADGGDRGFGPAGHDVLVHHLGEVHAVDVVGADHNNDVGIGVVDEVQGLVDGVGAAEEPALADALLCRNRGHVVTQLGGHAPRFGNVPVKAVGLVLRQHHNLQIAANSQD